MGFYITKKYPNPTVEVDTNRARLPQQKTCSLDMKPCRQTLLPLPITVRETKAAVPRVFHEGGDLMKPEA